MWCTDVETVRSTCLWAPQSIAVGFYVMETRAFHFSSDTEFFAKHPQVLSLTPQAPYVLYVDHGEGRESVPLEQTKQASSSLRVCEKEPFTIMVAAKMEDYQLFEDVLDRGLKELGISREDLTVETFATDKQQILDLYCGKGRNCFNKFHSSQFGNGLQEPQVQ